jgi:hypothetical protein
MATILVVPAASDATTGYPIVGYVAVLALVPEVSMTIGGFNAKHT